MRGCAVCGSVGENVAWCRLPVCVECMCRCVCSSVVQNAKCGYGSVVVNKRCVVCVVVCVCEVVGGSV